MWVRDDSAGYGNLDRVHSVHAVETVPGVWAARAFTPEDPVNYAFQLAGNWSTEAEVVEVIRKVTGGIDPSTY